jgi:hypothetical protein
MFLQVLPPNQTSIFISLNALANQLLEQIQALKSEQEAMLQELTTLTTTLLSGNSNYNESCFICDLANAHTPDPCHFPPLLVEEGLTRFKDVG